MQYNLTNILTPDVLARQYAHIVDLCLVKSAIGPLWPSVSEGVSMRFSTILKRNLQDGDISVPLDEVRYLITPRHGDSEQASLTALRIAHEFITELQGRCDLDQIKIERVTEFSENRLHARPIRSEEMAILAEKARILKAEPIHRRQTQTESDKTRIIHLSRRDTLDITHRFDPVWDARHEAITTYLCTPNSITAHKQGDDITEHIALPDLEIRERLDVELSCISAGIGYLSRCVETGDRFMLGLPVSFETLSAPLGRMEFTRLCRGIPSAYRPYVTFLLTDVPLGVAQSRLSDLAMLLRPFGRTIASVASGCRNFNAYQGHGLYALALDLSNADAKSPMIINDIVHIATAARNARMLSMVYGISAPAIVNQAIAAEIQLLQGAAIAPPTEMPKRMTHLPRQIVLPVSEEENEEWF